MSSRLNLHRGCTRIEQQQLEDVLATQPPQKKIVLATQPPQRKQELNPFHIFIQNRIEQQQLEDEYFTGRTQIIGESSKPSSHLASGTKQVVFGAKDELSERPKATNRDG